MTYTKAYWYLIDVCGLCDQDATAICSTLPAEFDKWAQWEAEVHLETRAGDYS